MIAAWLQQRQAEGNDPSRRHPEVIAAQQASRDALDDDEQAHSRRVDTHQAASLDGLIEVFASVCRGSDISHSGPVYTADRPLNGGIP